MDFDYRGICGFCGEEEEDINKIPIAGMRLCEKCLISIGSLFLKFIEKSRTRNDWEGLTTKELIGYMLNIINNSGIGAYYMLQENEYQPDKNENEIPDKF